MISTLVLPQNKHFGGQTTMHLIEQKRRLICIFCNTVHKAGGASPLGVARAACFEALAGVFASAGADALAAIS